MWNTACPPRWQREGIPVTSLGRVYSYWTGKLRLNKCCKFGNPRNMVWLFCRYLYMFGYIITSFFRVLPLKNRHFHTGYFAQTLIFLMRRSPIQRARGIQCLKRNSHTNYSDYPWMFKSQAHQLFVLSSPCSNEHQFKEQGSAFMVLYDWNTSATQCQKCGIGLHVMMSQVSTPLWQGMITSSISQYQYLPQKAFCA